jgi:diguanylate cyclase (GGDEF)-like protein
MAEVENRIYGPDNSVRWFRRVFYPYRNEAGNVIRIDGLMEDITLTKATLERLNILATTDGLTGLTNRTLFHDRFAQSLTVANRENDSHVVLLIMDLDHFKEINDTLGHQAGDHVLVEMSRRLKSILRDSDTIARLGGDEFGILLPHVNDGPAAANFVSEKIKQVLSSPCYYNHNELFVGASIGVAIYPDHGSDVSTLMSRADVAMYQNKKSEDDHTFYDRNHDSSAQHDLHLSSDLRYALDRDELVLQYQPKIALDRNSIAGAEALVRWKHPNNGIVSPDHFLPLAERSGLIVQITDWVITSALQQCKSWQQQGYDIPVAVNVSARVLRDAKFGERVENILERIAVTGELLEIEITENALISDIEEISPLLDRLSKLGISIAIDDFGTGYSSLSYLKTLPLDTLKIDKSFTLHMVEDENDAVIVRSTIDLAHNLGLKVVAEGVENRETIDNLLRLGCNMVQGYYFSKPCTAAEFITLLKKYVPTRESGSSERI